MEKSLCILLVQCCESVINNAWNEQYKIAYICSNIVRVYLRRRNLKYRVFVNHILLCEEALFTGTG